MCKPYRLTGGFALSGFDAQSAGGFCVQIGHVSPGPVSWILGGRIWHGIIYEVRHEVRH